MMTTKTKVKKKEREKRKYPPRPANTYRGERRALAKAHKLVWRAQALKLIKVTRRSTVLMRIP